MQFLDIPLKGALMSGSVALGLILLVMFFSEFTEQYARRSIGIAVVVLVIGATLYPHGWHYLQMKVMERPPVELFSGKLGIDDYFALASFHFLASFAGCLAGIVGYMKLRNDRVF